MLDKEVYDIVLPKHNKAKQKREDYAMKEIKKVVVENTEEIYKFAEKIKAMPECQNLTPGEKLKIIFAYPFKLKVI